MIALAALVALALCGGCDSRSTGRSGARAASYPVLRNLLLISIDTLRPDRLGCYGAQRPATPNIDRVAAEGVLFESCTSVAPLTLPAHSSLLTGTNPFAHGVRDNAGFLLAPENESLAELLAAQGYRTGAEIAAAVLNREFALDQGFAGYGDVRGARPAGRPPERSAEEIADAALAFLAPRDDKPFFLFVHFFDPHLPHTAPQAFRTAYPEDGYAAEIAYVDAQIGRLLDALRASGRAQDTAVIITSDHGESLGQHQERTHGLFVYDATLSIPLLIRAPGVFPAGRRVAAQARIIDVAPTAAALLGAPPLRDAQGVDLRALARGDAPDPNLSAYSESLYPKFSFGLAPLRSLRGGGWKYIHGPEPELYRLADDPGETRNLLASEPRRAAEMRSTLLRMVESARPIAGARKTISAEEQRNLVALGYAGGVSADEPLNERALLEPTGRSPMRLARELNESNDVMMLMQIGQYALAEQKLRGLLERNPELSAGFSGVFGALGGALAAQGKFSAALEFLEKAVEGNPRDGLLRLRLGVGRLALGRYDGAIEALEFALAQAADAGLAHANLATALAGKRDFERAREHFRLALGVDAALGAALDSLRDSLGVAAPPAPSAAQRANDELLRIAAFALGAELHIAGGAIAQAVIEAEPRNEMAHLLHAQLLNAGGERAAAARAYRAALDIAPRAQTWNALGVTLLVAGDHAGAAQALESGLALAPDDPNLLIASAWLLANTPVDALRNPAESVRRAERARGQSPDDATTLDVLAAAHAANGDFDAALQIVDAALAAARRERNLQLVQDASGRRALYERREAYRLPGAPGP